MSMFSITSERRGRHLFTGDDYTTTQDITVSRSDRGQFLFVDIKSHNVYDDGATDFDNQRATAMLSRDDALALAHAIIKQLS